MKTINLTKATDQVYKSNDYSLFSDFSGNRELDQANLKKIRNNVKNGIDLFKFNPIMVTEDYKIFDGQHRYSVCVELGLPIYFMIINKNDLRSIIELNNAQKGWSLKSYVDSYASLGYKEYIYLREFSERHKIDLSKSAEMLCGINGSVNEQIKKGTFKIKSHEKAEKVAIMYSGFLKADKKLKSNVVVRSCIGLVESERYDHKRMLHKIGLNQTEITICANVPDQLREFERVYNFKSRDEYVRLF